ncbi:MULTISPECIES: thiamine-phosphate kinase [Asticcacaulis]|uniref:thiamine-phosphate kinase n=1 Tax=Asticcacaulis TaxID=76890 RepID=UPI001AE7E24A|nr:MULTISPECIES: thiamine-phosphate kinase [Asticcacaulis]MBP2158379.1 thiamine-monophosphate kinase [Asticcacaulis solisilvae]MDR6799424.1 thiamine-monophosphate kinase [Asticcacaulis sp. BE141]
MAEHDEFSIIDQLFKPLAGLSREARGLIDDVSVLPADGGHDIVVNTDAIVAGVHFFEHDPLDLVARKLMRVNLSDIVAKGAKPYGYQLITAWPRGTTFAEKQDFARGLKIEQDRFGLDLFGGDTVSTFGPLHVSMTMFGKVPAGRALSRMGARPGDKVLVSGYIGQAYLGLKALEGQLMGVSHDDMNELMMSYHLPEIRADLATCVRDNARASMDISDGLLADADHMARANGLMIRIDLNKVPTSLTARAAIASGISPVALVTGGDDYQILCTADEAGAKVLMMSGFYVIGDCIGVSEDTPAGAELWADGRPVDVESKGYRHPL